MIRDAEKKAFEVFHACEPNFAGQQVSCKDGRDPPDFICTDAKGVRIGVELAEWVSGAQIAVSKQRHKIRRSYAQHVTNSPITPKHVGRVWLHPRNELKETEANDFRNEFFDFVDKQDSNWQQLSERGNPAQGIPVRDFEGYPQLQAHVLQLDFFPASGSPFSVAFLEGGGAYSPRTAFDALLSVLGKKVAKYSGLHQSANLAELYLVIYWWQGYIHNSPYDAPGYGLKEAAAELHPIFAADPGNFQKVFLFDFAKKIVVRV